MRRLRKSYPKDVGKRWCKNCVRETYFKWSDSENTYVCEICQYERAMMGKNLLVSEQEFMKALAEL